MRIEVGQRPYGYSHHTLWMISIQQKSYLWFWNSEKTLFFRKKIEISLGYPLYRLHLPFIILLFQLYHISPKKQHFFPKKSNISPQINSFQKSYTDQAGVFPIINPSAHINYEQMDQTTHKTLCWSHMTTSYLCVSSQIVALTWSGGFLVKKTSPRRVLPKISILIPLTPLTPSASLFYKTKST